MKAVAAATLAAALFLSGCSADRSHADPPTATDVRPLSEVVADGPPRDIEGPSTARLAVRAIEPVAKNPQQKLPATVTSRDAGGDRRVTVTDTSRVIAMDISGSIAATVWGLGFGDTMVGRDVSTTFPGASDLPVITRDGHSVNAEAVLDLEPTLVITDGSIGPRDVVEQLRDAGVDVVFVETESSYAGAQQLARDVAAAFGAPAAGTALAEQLGEQVEAVTAEVDRLAPDAKSDRVRMVFLYMRGQSGVYYLFGSESGADELITRLGGIDVAAEQGWGELTPLTDEAIVAGNPDLILVMTDGLKSVDGVDGLLKAKPAIALTNAGKHRRFVDMADGEVLSFGPRAADVLDALARAVYAPASTG